MKLIEPVRRAGRRRPASAHFEPVAGDPADVVGEAEEEEHEDQGDADNDDDEAALRRASGMTTIIKETDGEADGEGEVVDEVDGHGPTTMSDDGSIVEVRGDELEVSGG